MQNHKILYQFGKYLFNRENLSGSVGINARTQIEDTAFGDGSVRVNGIKRDYKGDYILTASFLGKENDDLNLFNFLVLNEPQQIFFTSVSKNVQGEESVKVYWNYASYVSMTQGISSGDNEDVVNYEINFRMFTPYFYECTKDVDLIIPEKRVNQDLDWNKFIWNDSTAWNDVNDSQLIPLANYTNQEQVALIGCCDSKYRLNYVDRYWKTNNKAPRSRNLLRSTDDLAFCIIQPPRTLAKWNQFSWGSVYWEPPNCNSQPSVSGKNWNSFNWNGSILWATINDSTATVLCDPICTNSWNVTSDKYWNTAGLNWNNFYWGAVQDLPRSSEIINGVLSIVDNFVFSPNTLFYQNVQGGFKNKVLTGGFLAKGSGSIKIGFKEYDIAGAMIQDTFESFTLSNNSYTQVGVTDSISINTCKLEFYILNTSSTPLTIGIANLQVNVGSKLLDYEPNMRYDRYDIDLSQSLPILTKNGTQTIKTREIVGSAIDQQFVQIRIPKMELGEYHAIYNKSNNTGYKISWLSKTTIDNAMILNCSKGQLFDVSTGAEINPEKGKVKLEIFGIKNLKLTPNLSPPDEFWETNTNTLEISSSTQKQQIIYLTNLNTYH
jgi:nitrite reductase/ring-hydroxylating ferredoxin subunit